MRKSFKNIFALLAGLYFVWSIAMEVKDLPENLQWLATLDPSWVGLVAVVVALALINGSTIRYLIWGTKPAKWILLRKAIDYVMLEAKVGLPTRKNPGGGDGFVFLGAKMLERKALEGKLNLRGRNEGQHKYEIIETDYWQLCHFDWEALLGNEDRTAGKTDIYAYLLRLDMPAVPKYVDLQVDMNELKAIWPQQSKWDKSKAGVWLRHKWITTFQKKRKKDEDKK